MTSPPTNSEWISCGIFGRPHGIKGEVRLWIHNPQTDLLAAGHHIWVADPQTGHNTQTDHNTQTEDVRLAPQRQHLIKALRRDKKGFLVTLEGISDRESAQTLNHHIWCVHRSDFPKLDEDEFYFTDLIGLNGVLDDGRSLGTLTDILETGASEVLVFHGSYGEVMVPYVPMFVLDLDLVNRVIKVRAVTGLLEGGI